MLLVPLTIDGAIRVVSSLMMKRNAILGLRQLGHLRLRARSSREIRVPGTRGKVRRSGGEVMLWKGGGTSADITSVLLRRVVVGSVATGLE